MRFPLIVAIVAVLALGACSAADVKTACAEDAALQPVIITDAGIVLPANPDVAQGVAVDTVLVHPLVQAACAAN